MVDQAKRNTLKNAAAIGVGTATLGIAPTVLASSSSSAHVNITGSQAHTVSDEGLIDIQIEPRVSSKTNDLEVVLTNKSNATATITDMTPAQIDTVRGRFDFAPLTEAGDLYLAAGESVTVPIQHHAIVLDSTPIAKRTMELTQALRRNASIIVNGDAFAATTVTAAPGFA